MQEHTKFICCIRQALGSLLPAAAGSALLEGSGGRKSKEWEKLPQVLLRLRANKPASPPHSRRKKQFIVTNGESLQRGWPFLSKLVNHTRRGEGLAVKWDMHHSCGGKTIRRTRLQEIPACLGCWRALCEPTSHHCWPPTATSQCLLLLRDHPWPFSLKKGWKVWAEVSGMGHGVREHPVM